MFGIEKVEGWFFSDTFRYYQQTRGRAVAYVSKYIGFYCLQVYERGQLTMCDIEYRTGTFEEAIQKGEQFLDKYQDKERKDMWTDHYSPHNRVGYWQTEYKKG